MDKCCSKPTSYIKILGAIALLLLGLLIVQTLLPEKALTKKVVIIDVRTPSEYNTGHIEEAINIPHDMIAKRIEEVVKEKDTEIHLYCRSGRRAEIAKKTLESMGYTNVINKGGYLDYKNELTKNTKH